MFELVIIILLSLLLIKASLKKYNRWKRKKQLRGWVAETLHQRDTKVHKCLLSSSNSKNDDHDDTRTNFYTAADTRTLIASGKLDPAENVLQLARRCRLYGRNCNGDTDQGVNAITEEFYDEAFIKAKELKSMKRKRDDVPLLYGVPISVKDCIAMKGALQTGGLACRASEKHRSKTDCLLLSVLRSAGALPMVRGNVSQIMMLPESYNLVWGRSRNPWDLNRVPGGSSGGEAALVAMKCVPLAVGSDVAGSIRIPAAFCGVIGFKPSSTRLSLKGSMRPRKNNKQGSTVIIPSVAGPIARSVEDCALFMKAVWNENTFCNDTTIAPLPFNEEKYRMNKPMRIGYFFTDEWFEPCTAVKRGLLETIEGLKKAGHTCIPFSLPTNGWEIYSLLISINAADGNLRSFVEALEGEDMVDSYRPLYSAANLPNIIRPVIKQFIDKRRATLLACGRDGGISSYDFWQKCAELSIMKNKWDDAVRSANIDAIIFPALPIPALPHGIAGDFTAAFSYPFIANMLQWPAGVVPVSTIRCDEQHYKLEDIPIDQRDHFAMIAAKVMNGSEGLPIGVAIMTRGFKDETCLRVMKEIESIVDFKHEPKAYLRKVT